MCLMNGNFINYFDKFFIVFLDDILIYYKSEEDNKQHLRMVLQVLGEHQLYEMLRKFSFYQRWIHYLGHIISKEGIAMDLEKIRSIEGWPVLGEPCIYVSLLYYVSFVFYFCICFILLLCVSVFLPCLPPTICFSFPK
jgi:hypothetical protein